MCEIEVPLRFRRGLQFISTEGDSSHSSRGHEPRNQDNGYDAYGGKYSIHIFEENEMMRSICRRINIFVLTLNQGLILLGRIQTTERDLVKWVNQVVEIFLLPCARGS